MLPQNKAPPILLLIDVRSRDLYLLASAFSAANVFCNLLRGMGAC
jgi:hypothetical protein